jgi:hypothetical protein
VPAYRWQRQHRLAASPSAHHLSVTLDGPPSAREIGMIHWDLVRFIGAAQHKAFNTHAKLALIIQPGACLSRRLRTRD